MSTDEVFEHTDLLESLNRHLELLKNDYKIIESLNTSKIEIKEEKFEDPQKENKFLKLKLKEKEDFISFLQKEIEKKETEFQNQINEKDIIIKKLQEEADEAKKEKIDSVHFFQTTPITKKIRARHSHQSSMETISTQWTVSTNESPHVLDVALREELEFYRKQLIDLKVKFAEKCSSFTDLESEFVKIQCRFNSLQARFSEKEKEVLNYSKELQKMKNLSTSHYLTNTLKQQPQIYIQNENYPIITILDDYSILKEETHETEKNSKEIKDEQENNKNNESFIKNLGKLFGF